MKIECMHELKKKKKHEEFPRMKQATEGDFRKQMYPAKHIEDTI